jgi:hypothetical protein
MHDSNAEFEVMSYKVNLDKICTYMLSSSQ